METLSFLFAAYSATWIVLFIYLFMIWRKQDRVEKGIQKLQKDLES